MDLPEIETDEQLTSAAQEDVPASGGIEKALRDLFPPLERHQRQALSRMIEAGEVKPRVVVWRGTGVVVDGRETKRICEEIQVPYETEERDFADLDAVVCWRIAGQLLHRNLTPIAAAYYRGKHYHALKRQGHRSDLTFRQKVGRLETAELLGKLYGVAGRTIERDGDLCKALDSVAERQEEFVDDAFPDGFILHADYRTSVLSGRARPTRGEILTLARMRPGQMERAIKDLTEARKESRRRRPAPPTPDLPPTPAPPPPQEAVPGPEAGEPPVPPVTDEGPPRHMTPPPPPAPTPPAASAVMSRCEGTGGDADAPASLTEPGCDPAAIDAAGLKDINLIWGRLSPATQLAFLTQDAVSKRACEAGFVRTDLPPVAARRTA